MAPLAIADTLFARPKSMSLTLNGCNPWLTNITLSSLMSVCTRPTLLKVCRAVASWDIVEMMVSFRHQTAFIAMEWLHNYLLDNQSDWLKRQRLICSSYHEGRKSLFQVLKDQAVKSLVHKGTVILDEAAFIWIQILDLEQGIELRRFGFVTDQTTGTNLMHTHIYTQRHPHLLRPLPYHGTSLLSLILWPLQFCCPLFWCTWQLCQRNPHLGRTGPRRCGTL